MSFNEIVVVGDTTLNFGNLYLIDASSNSVTLTLSPTTGNQGSYLQVKRVDWTSTNTVTVLPDAGDGSKIDAVMTSITLSPGQYSLLFVDNNAQWQQTTQDLGKSFIFGDGSDGVVSITSNQTLSRDMYYTQLDVSNGALVNTNGFRIFVADRLTLSGSSTTIHNNGGNASGTTAGTAAGGSTPGNGISSIGGGFAGGNGGAGLAGVGIQGFPHVSTANAIGGSGGNAGNVGGILGGVLGILTAPAVTGGGVNCIRHAYNALTCRDFSATQLVGGSGGGGGAANSLGANGGGGGGSGGIVMIAARSIVCDSKQSCLITAKGGAGANSSGSGNAGGGGGGGGGCVILISRVSNTLSNLPGLTVSVDGGAAGNGQGTGAVGTAGSAGTIQVIDRA